MLSAALIGLALSSVYQAGGESPPRASGGRSLFVYVGTYTGPKSKGIYLLRLDAASGALTPLGLAAATESPSFLALHPNGRFLYAVNEVNEFAGQKGGAVSAFAVQPDSGKLRLLNQQSSRGTGPCHLVVDRSGRTVLLANYSGGSVAALPVHADGRLGAATAFIQHKGTGTNPQRQEGPHAHSINVDPGNHFAVAADLGLDKVFVYRFDPTRSMLAPNRDGPWVTVQPGSGPRHFAFHPTGRFGYVINEMACTVTAFAYDAARGLLKELQTISTLPDGVQEGYSTAEVQVHPSGKFLYGSNRGHDTIAVFRIDPETGKLTAVEHQPTQGKTPRNFGIDPTGTFLLAANQDSDTVVVFRIDPRTGRLKATGSGVAVPAPVCVKFLAAGTARGAGGP
jgi:6-phosphogluconolactonase